MGRNSLPVVLPGWSAAPSSAASTLTPVLVSWHHHDLVFARWRTDHLSLVMSLIENGANHENQMMLTHEVGREESASSGTRR
jgi:hypothetical protein